MEPITLTISSVGQITIPRKVRDLLGLEKGAKLNLEIDKKERAITLKKQPTIDEVFAQLEAFHKTLPKPDPKLSRMTVNEMYDLVKESDGETWVWLEEKKVLST